MKRFETLDSIRGLAALSVLLFHMLSIFPLFLADTGWIREQWTINLLKYTPLSVLVSGHSAVILFFVVSGFVLALPFLGESKIGYMPYLIKRICRIYIPYWAALLTAVIASANVPAGIIPGLSGWFNQFWQHPPTVQILLQHFLLLGSFPTDSIDFVIWSLVHEARISLIFPLLMLVVIRWNWKRTVSLGLLLSLGNAAALELFRHWPAWKYSSPETAHYTLMFFAGALIARYRSLFTMAAAGLSRTVSGLLLGTAVCLYTYPHWFFTDTHWLHFWIWNDWMITLGSVLLITLALGSPALIRLLSGRLVLFLGKISYSLYLLHPIVILSLIRLLYGLLPLPLLALLCVPASLILSWIANTLVEIPSITLGRRLTRFIALKMTTRRNLDMNDKIAPYESH